MLRPDFKTLQTEQRISVTIFNPSTQTENKNSITRRTKNKIEHVEAL